MTKEALFQVNTRRSVLTLYRQILRTAKAWVAASGNEDDSNEERSYIVSEARLLFHKNKELQDPSEIQLALKEAEARLELALHYKNPYPRPVNVPPLAAARVQGKKFGKGQLRRRSEAKPVYIRSYEEYDKPQ
eukprot:gene8854-9802_t